MISRLGRTLTKTFTSHSGIHAIDYYFPNRYVSQTDLELHDGISEGKYTIGLGQESFSFVDDREDSVSMMLTVLHNLLEKYQIDPEMVGALYVGTETPIDRAKSAKSYLMQVFPDGFEDNTCLEGTDNVNACFGGTESLFNALYWCESHYLNQEEQKYALVVLGDASTYREPGARATSGAGAVAMLVGPHAPLEIDFNRKYFHMAHVYDFWKPDPTSLYPTVEGHFSNFCYLSALDRCFTKGEFKVEDVKYMLMHTPYNKLVQKGVGFLMYLDSLENGGNIFEGLEDEELKEELENLTREESYSSISLMNFLKNKSKEFYQEMCEPGMYLPKRIGNSYCSSLYISLCSLLNDMELDDLLMEKILMFSYGSGLTSGMFEIFCSGEKNYHSLERMKEVLAESTAKIEKRIKYEPENYVKLDLQNEVNFMKGMKDVELVGNIDELDSGTYYLDSVDELYRREYVRKN